MAAWGSATHSCREAALTYFNLPINYLFSQFIEGKPCHQAPWMLAGLGRGSHPHRSSCRSWLCCCPGHKVTRGPEELNAITRCARIQVSHYIGTSVASGHKSLCRVVTGCKAPAWLSPGLSMPRGHLHPSRSISLVLGGDFLDRSRVPRASVVETCVGSSAELPPNAPAACQGLPWPVAP